MTLVCAQEDLNQASFGQGSFCSWLSRLNVLAGERDVFIWTYVDEAR